VRRILVDAELTHVGKSARNETAHQLAAGFAVGHGTPQEN